MELSSLANGWVESYLEALLTTGLSSEHVARVQDEAKAEKVANAEKQICAKYYVQQILGLDEEGIRQAWNKANRSSAAAPSDKDARLEYLSWRVWGMRRKREVVLAEQSHEQEEDDEALDSCSEKSVDGDAESARLVLPDSDTSPVLDAQRKLRVQVSSVSSESVLDDVTISDYPSQDYMDLEGLDGVSSYRTDSQRLYVIMISMHGLVRGESMELGKDADTGGQVKYVVELAKAMALQPGVHRVDLLTRLIQDPSVDRSYGVEEECMVAGDGDMGGAYIIRLPCGDPKEYIRKELLWPHVREFADRGILHAKSMLARLQAAGQACHLQAIHGHYADAGEAAALMSHTLGVDMLLTGHSLGRNKLDHLLKSGTLSRAEIEATYAVGRRIEAEERAVDAAILVFTSTQQEINDQWGLYDGYNASLEDAIRMRPRKGRRFPHMEVIPPGLDFSNLKVDLPLDPYAPMEASGRPPTSAPPSSLGSPKRSTRSSATNLSLPSAGGSQRSPTNSPRGAPQPAYPLPMAEDAPIWREIFRFLSNPRKPVILAMSRPDAKKNITTLVKAFGECRALREIANLVLVMGNRDVIDSMASGSQKVLSQVLKLIDDYDLYGSVAYPKHHTQQDISDIYLLPAATRGVFINPALQEPFGLTLIEAAAHAVPIVATKHGGPVDIITTLSNGILVEPTDTAAIASALLKIVTEPELWDEYSSNGRANIMAYSWPSHCCRYLRHLETERLRAAKTVNIYHSYSASFDSAPMKAAIADAVEQFAAGNSAFAAAAANAAAASTMGLDIMMDRHSSLPLFASAAPFGVMAPPLSPLTSATDDFNLSSQISHTSDMPPQASLLRARPAYTVLAIDNAAGLVTIAELLHRKPEELRPAGAGLGVVSALSQRATLAALEAAGIAVAELDFLITGCGSEIWYPAAADGKLVEDSDYETHIDHCWDRLVLKRTVVRLLSSTPQLTTGSRVTAMRTTSSALMDLAKAPSMQLPTGAFRLRRDVGHFHLQVEIPKPHPQALAKLPPLICQRLRATGMRTQLTVQADPASESEGLLLHLTPLRASRALALRFMAHSNDLPMDAFTLVAVCKVAQGGAKVALGSSDGEEMLGGMQRVVLADASFLKAAAPFTRPIDMYNGRVSVLKV